ncbi:mechanosensitive ion channel family protein [Flavisolibacter ginsenosidimutans]|uniref:Mechanosensitive ion channel family protein n=1 Tax=Flavisolibacter ginsenosidimutans TaxID=661481 RepID=A0A5B8UGR1_9BACT|nr:mechanosensitive ion channel family protein [Flavisolibacter ginsenosidimutans]QEC55804.1 mechanosensitive ion channel family protein [Flavisolibacter ginsenosidimutans]
MDWSKFYDKAYNWILIEGPRILIGVLLVLIGLWLIGFIKKWLNHHFHKREVNSSVRPFLVNLFVTALQVLLFIAFMQVVGLQMTIFTAVIGAFGVAAGLALSGTLQNFTSGVLILLLKPFRIGDNIIAQGNEGTVDTIQIFFTIMKTFDNRTVIIPNSKLSNEIIVNLSREDKRRMDIEVKFPFTVDFAQVKNIVDKSVSNVTTLLTDPAHRVGVAGIDPDGYKVMINVWSHAHGFVDTKLLLQERIVDDLKSSGIKLPGL